MADPIYLKNPDTGLVHLYTSTTDADWAKQWLGWVPATSPEISAYQSGKYISIPTGGTEPITRSQEYVAQFPYKAVTGTAITPQSITIQKQAQALTQFVPAQQPSPSDLQTLSQFQTAPNQYDLVKMAQVAINDSSVRQVMYQSFDRGSIQYAEYAARPEFYLGDKEDSANWEKLTDDQKKHLRPTRDVDIVEYSRMTEFEKLGVHKIVAKKVSLAEYKQLGKGIKERGLVTPEPKGIVEKMEFWPTAWGMQMAKASDVYKDVTAGKSVGKKVEQGVAGFMVMLGAGVLLLPALPAQFIQNPKGTASGVKAAFTTTFRKAKTGDPWAIGESAAIALPVVSPLARMVKGGYTRLYPGAATPESLGIVVDVGREQVPAGMSKLAARELLGDIEILQGSGELPASRIRALDGVPNVKTVVVSKTPAGATDVKLKSADGDIVGHVSGMQRVNANFIYHATSNGQAIIKQSRLNGLKEVYNNASKAEKAILNKIKDDYAENGFKNFRRADLVTKDLLKRVQKEQYFEVKDMGAAEHHGMFWSQQAAQDFMARGLKDLQAQGVKPSPSVFSAKLGMDEIKHPPKSVLDSPTIDAMRTKMEALSAQGKLKPGVYTLYKGWRPKGKGLELEYELYVSPDFKFKVGDPTWYAKGDVPKTWVQSMFGVRGIGAPIKQGKFMPVYHFLTEQAAKEKANAVPSLAESYAAKVYGDMVLIRKYAPWRIRFKPLAGAEAEVFVDSPISSTFRPVVLSAVAKGEGGRASPMIFNSKGQVLLTRILGQERFDIVGGSPTKRWFKSENLDKAARRELYEEVGIKVDALDHVDTFQSRFTPKGKAETFQMFEGYSDVKPSVGSEIAEYAWWDGKSKLKYPVSDFTKEALARRNNRNNQGNAYYASNAVTNAIMGSKNKQAALSELSKLEKTMGDEVIKAADEAYRRGEIGYRLSEAQMDSLRASVSSSLRGREVIDEGKLYDATSERYIEDTTRPEERTTPEGRREPTAEEEERPPTKGEDRVPAKGERRTPTTEERPPSGGEYRPPPGEERPPSGSEYRPPPGEERPPSGGEYTPPPGEYTPPPGKYVPPPIRKDGGSKLEIKRVEGIPTNPGVVSYKDGIVQVLIKPPYREGTQDIDYDLLKQAQKGKGSQEATLKVTGGKAPNLIVLGRGVVSTRIIRGKQMRHLAQRGPGIIDRSGRFHKQRSGTVI